jgi:hypothetical protein
LEERQRLGPSTTTPDVTIGQRIMTYGATPSGLRAAVRIADMPSAIEWRGFDVDYCRGSVKLGMFT